VHRNTDGAGLIGDGARDGLANPPGGVGGELVTAAVLELVHGLHQADVAFLNQIEELQAAIGVLLGNRDHQAQVGFNQLALGLLGIHVALNDLALRALQVGNGESGFLFELFEVGLAVLLLAAVFLLELFALRLVILLVERANLALKRAHGIDGLVDLVEQALALLIGVLQVAHNARDEDHFARDEPAQLALLLHLALGGLHLLFERLNLLLVLDDAVDLVGRLAHAGGQYFFSDLFFVEDHHFLDAAHTAAQIFTERDDLANHDGRARDSLHHAQLAAFNALGDFYFAFACEQRNGAHFAQIHAHGVVGFFKRSWGKIKLDVVAVFVVEAIVAELGTAFKNVDSLGPDGRHQVVQVFWRSHVARDQVVDLVVGQIALFLTGVDELLQILFVFIV